MADKEYIDKEALKRDLIDNRCFYPAIVKRAIESAPIADVVEVVHGEWIPDMEWFDEEEGISAMAGYYQTGWKCSICGRNEREKEPYCNCGARMDGERKEHT